MAVSTNKTVVINRKISDAAYDEILPQEQANGVTFNNQNDLSTGILGDGSFVTDYIVRGFKVGTTQLFFLNDTIYSVSGSAPTVTFYRKYQLRTNEYFVDVASYENTQKAYLLTNQGRLYDSTGVLVIDYKTTGTINAYSFTGIIYGAGTSVYNPCVAVTYLGGVSYNKTGSFTSFQYTQTDEDMYGTIISMGFLYIFGKESHYSLSLATSWTGTKLATESYPTIMGEFKFVQEDIVVGTKGFMVFGLDTLRAYELVSTHVTTAVKTNAAYGGYLFNNTNKNITYIRFFKDSSKNLNDLETNYTITSVPKECFIFLIRYSSYVIGITQDGNVYKIIKG
jgi:hypothetical protein